MELSFLIGNSDKDVKNCHTYSEVVFNKVKSFSDKVIFRFLNDGLNESEVMTYSELDISSRSIGSQLQKLGKKGDPVLLLFQPGLDYVRSLFACLYTGNVAIPAYPPRRNRGIERIFTILRDSDAQICLTSADVYNDILRNFKNNTEFKNLKWVVVDDIDLNNTLGFKYQKLFPDDNAIIQYTSGSTGEPKGVILTQLNLIYNSEYIKQAFNHDVNLIGVNWLPLFHDMGLIGTVLQPAYVGGTSVLMPPIAFLKNPLNWLVSIEKYKANTVGGPNFTYDYCVSKINDEDAEKLDLSSIKVAFCGAEPIRESTYNAFSERFASSKFVPRQFYSCYGMAETTLIVTGGKVAEEPKYIEVDTKLLGKNLVVENDNPNASTTLVGCGHTWLNTEVIIVEPSTNTVCEKNTVGEVWVSGPTVAKGYWNKKEETSRIFKAKIDGKDGFWLRTGDLGFVYDGELYLTGRLKDLIIIRGVNYYPQDIERTVQSSISELRDNSGASFSITNNNIEQLVLIQELERTAIRNSDHKKIINQIRSIVSEEFELDLYEVVLVSTGSIPMTSSGKIQRRKTKSDYLSNNLSIVSSWKKTENSSTSSSLDISEEVNEENIKNWLVHWVSKNQHINVSEIEYDVEITAYGIDSLAAVTLEAEISKHFGFNWHISSFLLKPTINKLATEGVEIYNGTIS